MSSQSCWYTTRERDAFLRRVKPGDMVEFRRNGYQHWAVYIGRPGEFPRSCPREGLDEKVEYVIHRANPGDSDIHSFSFRGASLAKAVHGIGNVLVEPLDDVWCFHCQGDNGRCPHDAQARVNNYKDSASPPGDVLEIFARAFREMSENTLGDYNLVTNNCEHFATYCRYGKKCSDQVENACWLAAGMTVGAGAIAYALLTGPTSRHRGEEEHGDGRRYAARQMRN